MDGAVPRLTDVKPGCRFANRCPLAKDICFSVDPQTRNVSKDHFFRCHFGEEAL
ncbi:oligopeptide/dipeptide ABC transporter ATP-binding protein [Tissierella sp. P1]|uniref:oligopeptide/dipeptide ABC transporter ATP-binding protein n=1 Tax=Tissierella sp. P1 TaxID=1280483 RepID=UPI0019131074